MTTPSLIFNICAWSAIPNTGCSCFQAVQHTTTSATRLCLIGIATKAETTSHVLWWLVGLIHLQSPSPVLAPWVTQKIVMFKHEFFDICWCGWIVPHSLTATAYLTVCEASTDISSNTTPYPFGSWNCLEWLATAVSTSALLWQLHCVADRHS